MYARQYLEPPLAAMITAMLQLPSLALLYQLPRHLKSAVCVWAAGNGKALVVCFWLLSV